MKSMKSMRARLTFLDNGFWSRWGPTALVLVGAAGLAVAVLAGHEWDPMAFVRLGTRYGQGDPNGTLGYDGQFAYQIAVHPFGAAPYLDIPAYRYQRILYPVAAGIAGLGQPALIPWTLIALNVLALAAGTQAMGSLLASYGLSRWYAVTVGLFVGQLVSLRLDVNEPFSLAWAVLGIRAFEAGRLRWGAFWLALAVLSKETALAFVGGYLLYFLLKRCWRAALETGLISLGPFAVWQMVLWLAFGQLGLRSGGQGATGFSLIPFGGLLAFNPDDTTTQVGILVVLGPLVVLPSLALAVSLARTFLRGSFSPLAFALALHVVMMATLPFSTYVDLPGMLRLTSGLVVASVAYAAVARSRRTLNYSALWLGSLAYLKFFI
jgi:hypothetical protein